MPELPEVETIVNQLKEKIVGKMVREVQIVDPKMIDVKIKGNVPFTIEDSFRRGKSIVMKLSDGLFLLTHLRMTGHFNYISDSEEFQGEHTVAKFIFDDNSVLTHHSIRRFGSILLLSKEELNEKLGKLGREPLDDDFTSSDFCNLLQNFPRANLKNKLLDQKIIAGIGNIYVQEAMYSAGIHPERKIVDVGQKKLANLYHSLRDILSLSIKNNGTTVENFSHLGGKGGFQNFLKVYGKTSCPEKHILKKIAIGGRGTYFCPVCQK